MPATHVIQNTAPVTDSLPDSLAAEQAYYPPQYIDGFGDSVGNDTVIQSMSRLQVMEKPAGERPHSFVPWPLHDAGTMTLVVGALFLVVVSYRSGYKYIEQFFHNMFSTRRQESIFEDHTLNETQILSALIINTCVMEAVLAYCALTLYLPRLAVSLQSAITLHVAALAVLALAFYLAQLVAYKLIGYVFADKVTTKLWVDGFKASQSLLGLLLAHMVGLMLVKPVWASSLMTVGMLLYILSRLVFICKGFRIFYSNLPSIVYFILYLCAVEIVPIAIVVKAAVFVCGYLQS